MSSKKSKSKISIDEFLFPAILAGASILGLGILATQRFVDKPQNVSSVKPVEVLSNKDVFIEKICDDYLNENEKLELNYYKDLLPSEVIVELNDLILNSGASFINLNEYCNKKYKLGSMELTNCINYSKIKSSGCVRKKRDV